MKRLFAESGEGRNVALTQGILGETSRTMKLLEIEESIFSLAICVRFCLHQWLAP